MAYMKQVDLLRSILARAEMDRDAYIWAVGASSDEAAQTRLIVERIRGLVGKTLAEVLKTDREALRLACMYAESWYTGVAEAQVDDEKKRAQTMWNAVHGFRLKTFGKTRSEQLLESATLVAVPLTEVGRSST